MVDAVVPAGGAIDDRYAERIRTAFRALAPVGTEQTPVMQRVVDALRESGRVRNVFGVAPVAVQEAITGVDQWLLSGSSGPDNIRAGLAALPQSDCGAIVCTSDLPLISGRHVREFLDRSSPSADVTIGVVRKAAYDRAFPGSPMSEFVPFRDVGPITMACLFRVRPDLLIRNAPAFGQAFGARKSQCAMAMLLGPRLLAAFALRRLTLAAAQARAEQILMCRSEVLVDCPAELAFDIDTRDDYAYADARLS